MYAPHVRRTPNRTLDRTVRARLVHITVPLNIKQGFQQIQHKYKGEPH
jgi:hypothetical protein